MTPNLTPENLARLAKAIYSDSTGFQRNLSVTDFYLGSVMTWMAENYYRGEEPIRFGLRDDGFVFYAQHIGGKGRNVLEAALSCAVSLMDFLERSKP